MPALRAPIEGECLVPKTNVTPLPCPRTPAQTLGNIHPGLRHLSRANGVNYYTIMDFRYLISQLPKFMDALELTLGIGFIGMILAVLWGLILVGPRMSSNFWIRSPIVAYIELVRNTPLLLQVYVFYFALPLFGILISGFMCGVIGLASQHGAFLAEIYRGGIKSISKHQREAAKSLGMTQITAMRYVILPQALLKIAPSVSGQLILLLKDTAVVSAIGVMELTLAAKVTIERSAASMEVFILIAILYLILTSSLGMGLRVLETRHRKRITR